MNRRRLIPIGLLLTALALAVLVFQAPTPVPITPGEPVTEAAVPSPRSKVVLRRKSAPSSATAPDAGNAPVLIEGSAAELPFEPMDLMELPAEDLDRIAPAGLAMIQELHEACGHLSDDEGHNVAIEMTVDADGLLEMAMGSWEGESASFTDVPLPDDLVDCLDDTVWDLDWPTWEGGLRFALTTQFDRGDEDLD